MSTGCECLFIEVEKDQWWYVLEDYHAPKNSWDWREYAEAYGPFKTEDEADQHLRDNHANPGGAEIQPYQDGYQPDQVMQDLMIRAKKRDQFTRVHNRFTRRYF